VEIERLEEPVSRASGGGVWPPDDRVRRAFAETAKRYDDLARRRYRRVAREVIAAAGVRRGDLVLDVASGSGLVGRVMLDAGLPEPIELDISIDLLRLSPAGRRIAADAGAMPLKDEVFDVVVSNLGIQMLEDPVRGLVEIHRLIRPGGRVGLSTWGEGHSTGELDRAAIGTLEEHLSRRPGYDPAAWSIPQIVINTVDEMDEALADAGFEGREVHPRRKRGAFRGADHYFETLVVHPAGWARLNTLGDDAAEARAAAVAAVEKAVGHTGPFEIYEEVLIASGHRP
jgi:SAM-dependent methyltransferase